MDVGVPRCRNGELAPVNAPSVDRRGGQMKTNASQGAVGPKRQKTVVFRTPYKIPLTMSTNEHPLVDMMMMILPSINCSTRVATEHFRLKSQLMFQCTQSGRISYRREELWVLTPYADPMRLDQRNQAWA
ncbi:jg9069 [Pararge aegeria aegeria]|uniref:Jg9069 protein n=1 Tax=Pararge aegeria aegeria TaxID=348720 RepID=A0A8S4RW05_9NEOP|nr:jg9069 [Pararge aegeria aegeria]